MCHSANFAKKVNWPNDVEFQSCLSLQLSPECVAAAEDVDLVVVEGMGRAIETNLYASFSCDSLKLAMVKHPEVCLVQP